MEHLQWYFHLKGLQFHLTMILYVDSEDFIFETSVLKVKYVIIIIKNLNTRSYFVVFCFKVVKGNYTYFIIEYSLGLC